MSNKIKKCRLCKKKADFEEKSSKTTKKFQCTNCQGFLLPFTMRHFKNAYVGYPKWISESDWKNKRFEAGLIIAGATPKEINVLMKQR